MIIASDTPYKLKVETLHGIFEETIPNFDYGAYNYNDYFDEPFRYNHDVNSLLIDGEIKGVEVIARGTEEDEYDWTEFIVFQYKDYMYKINFITGSHGNKYKLDIDSLKSVTAKTKQVVFYE